MSEAKPEKERRFIRILIMIVTNVSLNTPKNVDVHRNNWFGFIWRGKDCSGAQSKTYGVW